MQNSLVSILIPVKNTEKFLEECLDSILQQEYKNWEVLAIDDGSTDSSLSILKTYAKNCNKIKVYSNSGTGIIDALRLAYAKSTGNFITRMDSDDIMPKNKLSIMVESLTEKGTGYLATGKVHYFAKEGISNGYARYESWLNSLTEKGDNFKEIYKECVIPSPCWMVHKDDFDTSGAFFSSRYPEDYDLAFRFYKNDLKVIPCNIVLHHWRDYSYRTSRTSEHYAANYFIDLKMHYFLELDFNANRPLALWGAGNKGKEIAKILNSKNIPFTWHCDNPKKIGKEIYNKTLEHFNSISELQNPQCIITVANEEEQLKIKKFFLEKNKQQGKDYFIFC
ncbi:glycosyltransferase involved in cell wall biosynthesis [Maribacter vaceletii]|uniref:Glycosyltransferase involved in cell wall biosynthesis n=1 Tax=Maribacter vaceletii TaxID=1206816 RepID=A0A495E9W3_9FLAO|nr:glycosyltransferase family 2 protein [Maribacter vaceletii]RKR13303.1 glycosyltransferase involved in cell wall biosynthesis [Maribacter vaceletii]